MKSNKPQADAMRLGLKKTLKKIRGMDVMPNRRYPHHILPILNQTHDEKNTNIDFKPSSYRSGFATPIFPPTTLARPGEDPVLRLVEEKHKLAEDVSAMRVEFEAQMKNRNVKRVRKTNEENVNLRIVRECAVAMNNDPDTFFHGDYDWYSTGSNLAIMDNHMLLHVTGRMNQLKWSTISHENGNFKIDTIKPKTMGLSKYGSVYELRTSILNWFSVRQKKKITIFDSLHMKKAVSIKSEVPFVSSDFLGVPASQLVTSDVLRTVNLWDLQTKETIINAKLTCEVFQPSPDPWSCVRQVDPNVIAFFDRQQIRLFDTRHGISDKSCIFTKSIRPYCIDCEIVSCAEMAPSRKAILIATTHKLFALEPRMEKGKSPSMIQWAHQMQTRPTILSVADKSDESGELIFVAGQLCGDVRFCETIKQKNGVFTSPFMPIRPNSLSDSYKIARRKGELLGTSSRAHAQIQMSTTGIIMFDSHLISQNSMGDLFAQPFGTEMPDDHIMLDEQHIAERIAEWDEQLYKLVSEETPIYANELRDLSPMADVLAYNLTNPRGVGAAGLVDLDDMHIEPVVRTPKWRQPIKKLGTYVDSLAKNMLKPWNVPEEPTPSITTRTTSHSGSRFANWLQQQQSTADPEPSAAEVLLAPGPSKIVDSRLMQVSSLEPHNSSSRKAQKKKKARQ